MLVLLVAMEMSDRTLHLQQMLIFKLAQKPFVSYVNVAHISSGSVFYGPAGNTLVILEYQYDLFTFRVSCVLLQR